MRMRWTLLVLAALALPARARAGDPFADFRIPSHGWRVGSATLGLSHSGSHDIGAWDDRSKDSRSALDGTFEQGWDSDAMRWSLRAVGTGELDGTSMRSRPASGTSREDVEQVHQVGYEAWLLAGTVRAYPWSAPVGLDLVAQIAGETQQDWYRRDDHLETPTPIDHREVDESRVGDQVYSLAASVGLGRVRDATVVMDVHVLEQRLAEAGALARPLSRAARERLAAVENVAPSLAVVLERPDRRLWRAIEAILREDGALSERGLDAYALMRAREPYRFATVRLAGWFAGPTVTLWHEGAHEFDLYERSTATPAGTFVSSNSGRFTEYLDSAWLGGKVEYHRPFGWSGQVDALASASGPVRPGDVGLRVESSGSATWLIADRWQAVGSVAQQRLYYSPRGGRGLPCSPTWRVACGGSFGYYVEDHVLLTLSLSEVQLSGYRYAYERDNTVSLGVTYRFLGRLEAPGLFDGTQPER